MMKGRAFCFGDFSILLSQSSSVILCKTLSSQKRHKNFAKCLISLYLELHLQKCRVITSMPRFSSSSLKIWGESVGIYQYTMVTGGHGSRSKFQRDSHSPYSSGGKCQTTYIEMMYLWPVPGTFRKQRWVMHWRGLKTISEWGDCLLGKMWTCNLRSYHHVQQQRMSNLLIRDFEIFIFVNLVFWM